MIIPIRCFTCGKVVADKYDYYIEEFNKLQKDVQKVKNGTGAVAAAAPAAEGSKAAEQRAAAALATAAQKHKFFDNVHTGEILNKMGLTRYCCRRHMIATVDMMDTI